MWFDCIATDYTDQDYTPDTQSAKGYTPDTQSATSSQSVGSEGGKNRSTSSSCGHGSRTGQRTGTNGVIPRRTRRARRLKNTNSHPGDASSMSCPRPTFQIKNQTSTTCPALAAMRRRIENHQSSPSYLVSFASFVVKNPCCRCPVGLACSRPTCQAHSGRYPCNPLKVPSFA